MCVRLCKECRSDAWVVLRVRDRVIHAGAMCSPYACSATGVESVRGDRCDYLVVAYHLNGTCANTAGWCGACTGDNCEYGSTCSSFACSCPQEYHLADDFFHKSECSNGICTLDRASMIVMCQYNSGYADAGGMRYKNECGSAPTVRASPITRRSRSCAAATGGMRQRWGQPLCRRLRHVREQPYPANDVPKAILCACPCVASPTGGEYSLNRSPRIVEIVVPIIVIIAMLVTVITIPAVACTRQCKERDCGNSPLVRLFGNFSSAGGSMAQIRKANKTGR